LLKIFVCLGEWCYGYIQGNVRWTSALGDEYTGGWGSEGMEGEGVYRTVNGSKYTGHFFKNQRHGHGVLEMANGDVYTGNWERNVQNGSGMLTFEQGTGKYQGSFKCGLFHGNGRLEMTVNTWTALYEGGWKRGMRCGRGMCVSESGQYEGEWLQNKPHGMGTMTDGRGNKYIGAWVGGVKTGVGKTLYRDGVEYDGEFLNGMWHSRRGIVTWPSGLSFVGGFKKGRLHGNGELTVPKNASRGEVVVYGNWEKGMKEGKFVWSSKVDTISVMYKGNIPQITMGHSEGLLFLEICDDLGWRMSAHEGVWPFF
jgi:hypothetical protein